MGLGLGEVDQTKSPLHGRGRDFYLEQHNWHANDDMEDHCCRLRLYYNLTFKARWASMVLGLMSRLQVLLSCLHTFHTVLVRRINKVIKNRDNFPCADIPYLFDHEPTGLVAFDKQSTIDLCF